MLSVGRLAQQFAMLLTLPLVCHLQRLMQVLMSIQMSVCILLTMVEVDSMLQKCEMVSQ